MTLVKFNNGNGTMERPLTIPSLLKFNDLFDQFLTSDAKLTWMPAVNIIEKSDEYRVDLAVPGMDKKDFSVEVDKGILTVSGERKEEKIEENERVTCREFHYGSFKRQFILPDSAEPEKVSAKYKDGLLTLTILKKEEAKEKPKRQIDIL